MADGTWYNWWLPDWLSQKGASQEARRSGAAEIPEAERDPLTQNAYWTPADEAEYQNPSPLGAAVDAVGSMATAPVSAGKKVGGIIAGMPQALYQGIIDAPEQIHRGLTQVPQTDAEVRQAAADGMNLAGLAAIGNAPLGALAAQGKRAAAAGAFARETLPDKPSALGFVDDATKNHPARHNGGPPLDPNVTGSKELFTDTPATVNGKWPSEWGPEDFQAYGEKFGVKEGFGGTSGTSPVKGLDGTTYDIPNSFLKGEKGTYYDQLQLKAAAVNPRNLPPEMHSKIHEGLLKTVTPDDVGPERLFNQQLFGITSPNQPLTPNAFAFGRLMAKSGDDISKIADMTPWSAEDIFNVKGGPKSQRAQMSRDITKKAGLNAEERGGLGASGSADYTRVADLAKLAKKDPEFFRFKGDPNSAADWEAHVGKIASQVPGLSYKTGSLGSVFENPLQAMISAIDRHMVRSYKRRGGTSLFETPKQERAFEKSVVQLANKRREEAARALAKKNKTRYRKPEKITRYEDVGEGIIGEQLLQHLNSHKSPKYRLATGELNPNVPEFYKKTQFPVEPPTVSGMSEPYRGVLNANALDAVERPYGVFGEQWRHWDTLRQRLEPHEWMNPVLEKVGRMNLDQLKMSDAAHNAAGYKAAEGAARPTQSPGALAIFANDAKAGAPGVLVGQQATQAREWVPSRASGHLEGVQDMPYIAKESMTQRSPFMKPDPAQSGPSLRGVGAYEGSGGLETNPMRATPYNATPEDVNAIGSYYGGMMAQDAVPSSWPKAGIEGPNTFPANYADIATSDPLSIPQMQSLGGKPPGGAFAVIDDSKRGTVRYLGGDDLSSSDIVSRMADEGAPGRVSAEGVGSSNYPDFSDAWKAEPGSGQVTRQMLDAMDQATPGTRGAFDSFEMRQRARAANMQDFAIAERYGLKTRDDLMRMREIYGKEGFEGLRAALARGDALPSNADVAGIVSLITQAGGGEEF